MLIEFRIGNFRSFGEPQTFSLISSSDNRHVENCLPFGKLHLLKSAAIFGANASGKSNLFRALGFLRQFVLQSATTMNIGDAIPVTPFQLDPDMRDQPSFFEVAFLVDGVRYQYGFTATMQRVEDEWLIAYPKRRPQHLLERRFDRKTKQTTCSFRGELHREGALLKERTRDNGLVLARGAELNVNPLTTVLLWFRQQMTVLDLSSSPEALIQHTAKRLQENPTFRDRIMQLIRHADLSISDVAVTEEVSGYLSQWQSHLASTATGLDRGRATPGQGTTSSPVLITPGDSTPPFGISGPGTSAFSSFVIGSSGGTSTWPLRARTIRSIHQLPDGESISFDFLEAESLGTQRFFALAGLWLDALDRGTLLVIDELDCSMHPTLTRKLIELFQAGDATSRGAQLIFSTHDSTLMDPELFRRDQMWLVEKNSAGMSQLSSLYDFEEKPRNNEALQRRYLAGHYGGVPVFGPTFEDLELK